MFAKRKEIDIFYDNHLAVLFLKLGRKQHFMRVYTITVSQIQHRFRHPLRCFQQSFAVGIFAQQSYDTAIMAFQFLQIRRIVLFFFKHDRIIKEH